MMQQQSTVHSPQSTGQRRPGDWRWSVVCGLWTAAMCLSAPAAWAGLELSTDHRSLYFGVMQLGEEKDLAEFGAYHNEIAVSSTNNQTWYLKINLLHPLSSGAETIPVDALQWQVISTDGNGTIVNPYQPRPFSLIPDLVYISGPSEAAATASGTGATVHLRFQYRLKIPEAQVRGVYQTTIRFTLTEIL